MTSSRSTIFATAMLIGAMPIGVAGAAVISPQGIRAAAEEQSVIDHVQYRWTGYEYCWYDDGWRGPGFYRCGYRLRVGYGWGGPAGWHGWRVGGQFRERNRVGVYERGRVGVERRGSVDVERERVGVERSRVGVERRGAIESRGRVGISERGRISSEGGAGIRAGQEGRMGIQSGTTGRGGLEAGGGVKSGPAMTGARPSERSGAGGEVTSGRGRTGER